MKIKYFTQLLKDIVNYCRKKAILLEFRHFESNITNVDIFTQEGFYSLPWYNIITDYTFYDGDIDKILSNKRLSKINKALDSGVTINYLPTELQWKQFYILLKKLYKKIYRPLPNYSVFEYCLKTHQIARCITIEKEDRVLAGAVVLILKDKEAYLWYETVDRTIEKNDYSGSIVCYAALLLAKTYNVDRFNLLGAGQRHKQYGVRDFKLKFGGKLIEEY